jgi:response regulator RpfG family c-di-GMP phosphodiesterase
MSTAAPLDTPESTESQTLRLLLDIGQTFNSSLEFPDVVNTVMDKVIEVFRAERGCLFVASEEGHPRMVGARGIDRTVIQDEDFRFSRSLVRRVMETREPMLSNNAMGDERFADIQTVAMHSIRSIMAVPILFQGRISGLIYVDNRLKTGIFHARHLELLAAIATLAASAIENARLYNMKKEIILVLANAIEAKDEYTRGHVERVCGYCLAIAQQLGLSADDMRDLEVSSFLHDVGKIGVPDAVLQKPGRLDDLERVKMERHAELGEQLVGPIDIPKRIKQSIRQHQERWDGKGYPDGAQGEQIHLFARIIAVADTWDAMTSDRPYRKALSTEVATAELRRCAGTQLDPMVVDAFLRAVATGHYQVSVRVSIAA